MGKTQKYDKFNALLKLLIPLVCQSFRSLMHYNFCSLEIQLDWVLVLITELYMLLHPPCMCPTTWYYGMSVRADGTREGGRPFPHLSIHFFKNMFSFSKRVSKWAFIFKMYFFERAFIFKMCPTTWYYGISVRADGTGGTREFGPPKPNPSIENSQLVRLLQDFPKSDCSWRRHIRQSNYLQNLILWHVSKSQRNRGYLKTHFKNDSRKLKVSLARLMTLLPNCFIL